MTQIQGGKIKSVVSDVRGVTVQTRGVSRSLRAWVGGCGHGEGGGGGGGYLLWWGRASGASPSELCRECADAPDAELP